MKRKLTILMSLILILVIPGLASHPAGKGEKAGGAMEPAPALNDSAAWPSTPDSLTSMQPEAPGAEPDSTLQAPDEDEGVLHSLRVRIRALRAVINAVLNLLDRGLGRLALSSTGD